MVALQQGVRDVAETIAVPDIATMPAGPEMDELVATRVFGWAFKKPNHGYCCTCQRCGRAEDDCHGGCYFSDEIEAAWPVVEKMRENGWEFIMHSPPIRDGRLGPGVTFSKNATADQFRQTGRLLIGAITIRAETAPLAICRAALIALEAS